MCEPGAAHGVERLRAQAIPATREESRSEGCRLAVQNGVDARSDRQPDGGNGAARPVRGAEGPVRPRDRGLL